MEWPILLTQMAIAGLVLAVVTYRDGRFARLKQRFWPAALHDVHLTGPETERQRERARQRATGDVWPQVLPPIVQARYVERWRQIQLRFVYEPAEALQQADGLVDEILHELGYRSPDLQVGNHPSPVTAELLADYTARTTSGHSTISHEIAELRRAFVRDRALFDQLLATTPPDTTTTDHQGAP